MPHPFFKGAAFLGTDGKVYESGPFHDISVLPSDIDVADEGFVGHNGKFYSREQATALVDSSEPVQSEKLFDQKLTQPEIDAVKQNAQNERIKTNE